MIHAFKAPSITCALAFLAVLAASGGVQERQREDTSLWPPPLDPQAVRDQDDMTWADYRPIPGIDWADPSRDAARKLRVALVAVDFPDQPFVVTLPRGSDLFGNPQIDPIPRSEVARFYADFFGKPGKVNHGHTINGYWMEQSRGKVGIPPIDAFGPYRMPKRLFQYGLNEWGQGGGCPPGYTCDGRIEPDADALWAADAGADIKTKYDIVLRIYAGYDETGVWQEFGEMKFATKEDIPPEWGSIDPSMPRWVATRYVPWTSWKAGQQQWGLSSVRQGENSGTITHEIAHHAFRTGDNNNNPYVEPYRRVGSGPWDIMDRGSFNGPGGPHRRWVVPATEGAFMPAGFMLRNRLRYEFVAQDQVLRLSRQGLASSGLAVATVTARAVEPLAGQLAGITVTLDGEAPQDRTPACDMKTDPLCPGQPAFNFYSLEVVQRIGYDSFTPDNGVLLAKNKDREGNTCGYNCFTWVIDARPQDIRQVDFKRADGTTVMRTVADYRQLNDALFHAGPRSGSAFERRDEANRLHFYVLGLHRNDQGILSYQLGVRSLDGSGPHTRGVSLTAPETVSPGTAAGQVSVTLANTGELAAIPDGVHPQDARRHVGVDIYRLSLQSDGGVWETGVQNELVAVPFGGKATVQVLLRRRVGGGGPSRVALTAVSESDPTRTARATFVVK